MRRVLGRLCVAELLAISLSFPVNAEAYGSGWYGEVQASYGYENNISRTYESDAVDDAIASVSLGGGYSQKLGRRGQLILSGYFSHNRHHEYSALNNYALSLGLDLTFQPTPDFRNPWYRLVLNTNGVEYKDSDQREGVLFEGDFSINKRLNSVFTGHAGYRYDNFFFLGKSSIEEKNDAAFERISHEMYLGLDRQIGSGAALFLEIARSRGDLRSTLPGGKKPGLFPDAKTLDTVFDPTCKTDCQSGYAYRSKGKTTITTAGIVFPVGEANVDLGVSYHEAKSDLLQTYRNWTVKMGVLWQF